MPDGVRSQDAPSIRRLGKTELGPHAFEKMMPDWQIKRIRNQQGTFTSLKYGPEPLITVPLLSNETANIIPTLRGLSASDQNVESFAYCHPAVNHLGNRYRESGFCGYRSISMMLAYLRGCSTAPKRPNYASSLPNILDLQEMIEQGWAQGINSDARLETGGVRGTRKFIGTSEVETCLRFLKVPCSIVAISPSPGKAIACDTLLNLVEKYFTSFSPGDNSEGKPPIFLQRKGHSLVVIGFEKWRIRKVQYPKLGYVDSPYFVNLIVLDCAVDVANTIKSLRDKPTEDLKKYLPLLAKHRVDRHELERYDQFELVFLEDEITLNNQPYSNKQAV